MKFLNPLPFYILLNLGACHNYGSAISWRIWRESNGLIKIPEATLYTNLKRLKQQGLITKTKNKMVWAHHRKRKFYILTDRGRDVLAQELKRLTVTLQWAKAHHLLEPLPDE